MLRSIKVKDMLQINEGNFTVTTEKGGDDIDVREYTPEGEELLSVSLAGYYEIQDRVNEEIDRYDSRSTL